MILVTKNLIRGSFTKIIPWGTKIGLQNEIPKEVAILFEGLGVLLVESNIWVSVLPERMVAFGEVVRDK